MRYALIILFSCIFPLSLFATLVILIVLFTPLKIWNQRLNRVTIELGQADIENKLISRRVYVLGALLASLIALLFVAGLNLDSDEEALCKANAAKMHVTCQMNEDDESG